MGALFGSFGAMWIGVSDLYSRRVANVANVATIAASVQVMAALTALGSVVFVSSELVARDLALGALAGCGMAVGLAGYYGGVMRSSATVVAPVVGTLSATIPFGYAVATGSRPSGLAWFGLVIALVGLVIISSSGSGVGRIKTGLMWGLMSGCGYGFAQSALVGASTEAGSWPAFSQRLTAFCLTLIVAQFTGMSVIPPAGVRRSAAMGGAMAGLASVFFLLGAARDAPATVVTFSVFPAYAVLIGWIFYGEVVRRRQVAGLVAVLVGVASVVGG